MRQLLSALKAKLFGGGAKRKLEERRRRSRDKRSPVLGEYVIYHRLKMKVTRTQSNELWKWLVQHGWRVAAYPNDRRKYYLVSEDTYAKLDFAATTERPAMIRALLRRAKAERDLQ